MVEDGQIDISVVVPAYNEETRLQETLPLLCRVLKRRFGRFEIIIVDDGSSDKTADYASCFAEQHPQVGVVSYSSNRGKGFAVRTGMLAARGKYVLFSDADLSTPILEIRKLIRALEEGADVAIGSRARQESKIVECQPFYRIFMGKTFNKIVRLLAVRGIADTQCGFKCFRREVAQEIFSRCRIDGFGFDVEVLFVAGKKGMTVREVGVMWRNSPESKVDPIQHSLQMLKEILFVRWYSMVGYYGPAEVWRTSIES